MNIICFGQQNWDVCWTGKQQLMTRLARRGHRILYVDPTWDESPTPLRRSLRALLPRGTPMGLRYEGPGQLHVFTYHYNPLLRWRMNVARERRMIRGIADRLGLQAPLVISLRPDAGRLMKEVKPQAKIYFAVDEMSAFGGTPDEQRAQIRAVEEALLQEVDLAIAVSPRLHQRFRELQPRSYLLENGADVEHFSPASLSRSPSDPAVAMLPRPRLGFVGQVDDRLDQPLLAAVARSRPEWQIVLAGRIKTEVDFSLLQSLPNIHFLGYRPYEELPSVLREFDVCLVPYQLTELTQACNPLKVFEYLATGLPVVSTPLAGLQACRQAVALVGDATEFERAVDAAIQDPDAGREERLAVAAANTWDSRVDELERRMQEAIDAAHPHAPPGPPALSGRRAAALGESREHLNDYGKADPSTGFPSLASRALFEATRVLGWAYYALRVASRAATGQRPVLVRKILVVRHTCLGDLIVFLPLLAELRARLPHARLVLGVQPGMSAGALLEHSDAVDEIRVLDFLSRPTRAGQLKGAAKLFMEGFDVVISGLGYFLLHEAFFSGAPRRIGHYDGHALQRFNSRVIVNEATRHESDSNLALADLVGGAPVERERFPELVLDEPLVRAGGTEVLRRLNVRDGSPLIAMHPGSSKPSRRWPTERFALLAAELLERRPELRIVFTGVPSEQALVDGILSALPEGLRARALSSIGLTDLTSMVGVLDRSSVFVSNDTGVMHLARARGVPLVALIGPENHLRWGPHPRGLAPAIALRSVVPCAPCARPECEALYCMKGIAVADAVAAVETLLGGEPPTAAGALQTRVARHGWQALADAGFELPLVSAVIPPDAPPTQAARANNLDTALAAVQRQSYPNLEIVRGGLLGAAPDEPGRDGESWRAILESARGELIVIPPSGGRWAGEELAQDVAMLMRNPDAPFAPATDGRGERGRTFRRSYLESLLSTERERRIKSRPVVRTNARAAVDLERIPDA